MNSFEREQVVKVTMLVEAVIIICHIIHFLNAKDVVLMPFCFSLELTLFWSNEKQFTVETFCLFKPFLRPFLPRRQLNLFPQLATVRICSAVTLQSSALLITLLYNRQAENDTYLTSDP